MQLTNEQLAKANELVKQGEAYERLREGLPEDILATWYKFVGQMREYFYMDEQWDGQELVFVPHVKAILEPDKITISTTEDKPQQWTVSSPGEVDEIIQALVATQLPERVIPKDNIQISAGGGRCDLCLYNHKNSEKRGSIEDLAMGFALAYGVLTTSAPCTGETPDCTITDIGQGTPGLTAEQVTHILFPYWWTKSRFNN